MTQTLLTQRLTSTDASFLYIEKPEAPMHVGSISVFDGEVDFEAFVDTVEAKLPLLPRYRQKVVFAPFNMGHPTWENDPNFNIRNHIHLAQIDAPGNDTQLSKLGGQMLSGMMNRNQPLWEIWVVMGLAGGRSAIVTRVHHAMIDGISGVDLTKVTFDLSPNPPPLPPKPAPESLAISSNPDITKRLIDGWLGSVEEGMKSWTDFQTGLLNFSQTMTRQPSSWLIPPATISNLNNTGMLQTATTPPTILPFNRPNTRDRRLVWSEFSFAEARAIRAAVGGTVNDVVLTVLSGAISQYVKLHQQKVAGRTLRVMVPVSMRREEQRGALGNLVSVLPVELPLDIEDPLERMRFVTKKTGEMKTARVAEGINLFSALLGTVPASMQALLGSLASSPVPVFNTVCTNVPGPQIPLYVTGKKMVAWYPYVPIGFNMGVGCAIMSYDQKLFFGLTSDTGIMPDVERLKEFLEAAFAELREAAKTVS